MDKKIVIFKDDKVAVRVSVSPEENTVWLNRQQIATLFDRDVKTIGKHIKNALHEELSGIPTVANFATVQIEGKRKVRRLVEFYNLDLIISVGYRVKSRRGVAFRRWANSVLNSYIMQGYAINKVRIKQLGRVIQIIKRNQNTLDSKQVLSVIENYNSALSLLDDYDHQCVERPAGNRAVYVLTYKECRDFINQMEFNSSSSLFGHEKDDSFKGCIGNIYQTIAGEDVYPTLQEKAANLLYFITKDHSFNDGNKRIAAAMFLYFLDKNNMLYDANGNKLIDDHTLVALTILIAESCPDEKEIMISIIMNCCSRAVPPKLSGGCS